jgi:hypothetical protein
LSAPEKISEMEAAARKMARKDAAATDGGFDRESSEAVAVSRATIRKSRAGMLMSNLADKDFWLTATAN